MLLGFRDYRVYRAFSFGLKRVECAACRFTVFE